MTTLGRVGLPGLPTQAKEGLPLTGRFFPDVDHGGYDDQRDMDDSGVPRVDYPGPVSSLYTRPVPTCRYSTTVSCTSPMCSSRSNTGQGSCLLRGAGSNTGQGSQASLR